MGEFYGKRFVEMNSLKKKNVFFELKDSADSSAWAGARADSGRLADGNC
jgi:hypothetical protein